MGIEIHLRREDNTPHDFPELLVTGVTIYQGQSVKLKPKDTVMNLFSCFYGAGKFCLTSMGLIDSRVMKSIADTCSGLCLLAGSNIQSGVHLPSGFLT